MAFDTLVVNLFAGPGAGKSTVAAMAFAELKEQSVDIELVTEFAKELAWEEHHGPLQCQPYVFGQQLWRIQRLIGKVRVVITDSPILLSAFYAPESSPRAFIEAVKSFHAEQHSLNVEVIRTKCYNPRGRFQTETEARAIDLKMRNLIPMFDLQILGNKAGAGDLVRHVQTRLVSDR